jgi:hypothetical protein
MRFSTIFLFDNLMLSTKKLREGYLLVSNFFITFLDK